MCVLLQPKQVVSLQLLLFLGLVLPPSPESPPPLLGVEGQQDDQAGLEQVARPAVHLGTPLWQVVDLAPHGRGDGIGGRAVPVPEQRGRGNRDSTVLDA